MVRILADHDCTYFQTRQEPGQEQVLLEVSSWLDLLLLADLADEAAVLPGSCGQWQPVACHLPGILQICSDKLCKTMLSRWLCDLQSWW